MIQSMNRWVDCALDCRIVRATAAAVALMAVSVTSSVVAQTLTEPSPTTKSSGRGAIAQPPARERATACATYGAGFVQMPGSDACIKLGGYVTMQSGVGSTH